MAVRKKRGRPPKFTPEQAMVTTTISLDEATHRKLRHLAVDEGVPLRDLIRTAVREYIARHGARRR